MASFAHALRSFRSGDLSPEEFIAEVDRILSSNRTDEAWLLETLDKEHTRVPLPKDVHDAVRRRIEDAAHSRPAGGANSGDTVVEEDLSRTQLATSLFGDPAPNATVESPAPAGVPDVEPMKGMGDVLNDRFVLEERVGAGGMSTVYRALDKRKLEANDRDPYVAVKVLNVEFRAHPDSLIALQREAKKCQRLAHPNIVRVYDFDRDGSTVYMTMEYLSGVPLSRRLRAPDFNGMPLDEAMPIIEGMAAALGFAHQNGIVHADFKPANVILTDDGEVKVIDFGIARAFQRPGDEAEATRFDPGSLGALTPTYASPEMLEHREPDPRDDVYALACITYEMLTGRHPFGRRQATEARDGGLGLERRNLSRRQWKALKAALAFDRDKRTGSAGKFLDDLRARRAVSVPLPVLAGSAVGLLLLAGSMAYFMTQPERDEEGSPPLASPGPGSGPEVGEPPPPPVATPEPAPEVASAPPPPVVKPLDAGKVAALVAAVPCSALTTQLKGNDVQVSGFLSRDYGEARLVRELKALEGAGQVRARVAPVEKHMCGAVETLAPYWRNNQQQKAGAAIGTANAGGEFVGGEPLIVDVKTPAYKSYLHVDYHVQDGHVVHLLPNPHDTANEAPPRYQARLGDLGDWIISKPFGTELITLVAAPQPLFPRIRDEVEKGGTYLKALDKALAGLSDKQRERVAADFVLIHTRAKK